MFNCWNRNLRNIFRINHIRLLWLQGFGSGSALIRINLDPDQESDPDPGEQK